MVVSRFFPIEFPASVLCAARRGLTTNSQIHPATTRSQGSCTRADGGKKWFLNILVFLRFWEVSDCRFGFLVKNTVYIYIYIYIASWTCLESGSLVKK